MKKYQRNQVENRLLVLRILRYYKTMLLKKINKLSACINSNISQNYVVTLQNKQTIFFSRLKYSNAIDSKFSNKMKKAFEMKVQKLMKKKLGRNNVLPDLFTKTSRSRIFSSPLNSKSREAMIKISYAYQKPLTSYNPKGLPSRAKPVFSSREESKDFKTRNSDLNWNKQSLNSVNILSSIKSKNIFSSPQTSVNKLENVDAIVQRRESKIYSKFVRSSLKINSPHKPTAMSSRYSNLRNSKCELNSPFSIHTTTQASKKRISKSKIKN